jgi:MFS family permease
MFTNWPIPLQIGRVIHGFGFTEARAGSLFTFSALMFSAMTMLVAPALPKYHPKTFPLIGAVATAIGFAVIAMALTSPALVLAGLLLVGAGQGAAFGGAVALSALSARSACFSVIPDRPRPRPEPRGKRENSHRHHRIFGSAQQLAAPGDEEPHG